ncbi:hypothetical protein SSP35_03_04320 [Streptomyces sp. NBRC 110611]|nr:hypothetical protein SSP35_03_04320 [Streptomyces sp. NBRC 110611]
MSAAQALPVVTPPATTTAVSAAAAFFFVSIISAFPGRDSTDKAAPHRRRLCTAAGRSSTAPLAETAPVPDSALSGYDQAPRPNPGACGGRPEAASPFGNPLTTYRPVPPP